MTDWEPFNYWMELINLSVHEGLTSCFTIGYRLTDNTNDKWTIRFNRFKSKNSAAINGAMYLMKDAVPLLANNLELKNSKTVFIPALSSSETIASENGVLSLMTSLCANEAGMDFVRNAVMKEKHTPLHHNLRAETRNEILDNANYNSKRINAENIVIIDDFITRGDTLSHMARAILETNPGISVYGVALAKTDRCEFHRKWYGKELSNNHIPPKWETLWNKGEEQYRSMRKEINS